VTTTPLFGVAEPTPQPVGYGLYSAATVLDPADPKAQNGVQWEPSTCGVASPFKVRCPTPDPLPAPNGWPVVQAYPFGVGAGVACKTVGISTADLRDRARNLLRLTEEHAVEFGYWTGQFYDPSVPGMYLAHTDATVLSVTPVAPKAALGMLEDAIGDMTGAVGVIHAARHAVGVLASDMGLRQQGGRLLTILDTPVAAGAGYPGTGPDGTRPAGTSWLYATGAVQVVRGPVQDLAPNPRDSLDRSTNDARVHAVRLVSPGHNCGVVAVPINLA
jgi:hypothetical protein